jgi:hypothetical protein
MEQFGIFIAKLNPPYSGSLLLIYSVLILEESVSEPSVAS